VYLEELIRTGEIKVKTYNRALGLLELDRGKTYTEVAKTLQKTLPTVSNWAVQYKVKGLKVLIDEAQALAERFEFCFTPKSASWLNMIEIEFSALSRECLDRRIPTLEHLEKEVLALVTERDAKQIKIQWQFSIQSARSKLNSHYTAVHEDNKKFKET
jgi:recombinational DNA repair ATPase RecF